MKNIHLIQTDKPTGIFESNSGLQFSIMKKVRYGEFKGYNLCITNDEEIELGDFVYSKRGFIGKFGAFENSYFDECKKIILTTDDQLIKDGVQTIDDDVIQAIDENCFIEILKEYQQEQDKKLYSEEDVINALHSVELKDNKDYSKIYNGMKEWFEQNKKK